MGLTHMNKLLSTMNIPTMDDKLFKRHERLVGPTIELVAKGSCMEAVKREKAATIVNVDKISELL